MMACERSSGEFLVAASAALGIQIAHERTADELALLAAFFTLLGDQLALLALRQGN